jgi:predicted PurR-regulated permease PerM
MSDTAETNRLLNAKTFMEVLIRFSLVAFIVVLCARVFAPFTGIMLWALIMAVALYPVHQKFVKTFSCKQGRASTIMVILLMVGFGVPMFFLANSTLSRAQKAHHAVVEQTYEIKPPSASVQEWPVVGERVYQAWDAAATNLPELIKSNHDLLVEYSKDGLGMAMSGASSILKLFAAFIVASVMMAFGDSGIAGMKKIFRRACGPERGEGMRKLCTATVRSVAVGVLGVAIIQSLLFGVGFIFANIPAAGVLTFVVLVMGILQLPALLLSIPIIAYMWMVGDASTAVNVVFTIFFLIAALTDNVLKPMLLGRGVDAPMPVILIGALGGMITAGFIGLFIGAVLLAVGYQVFMGWVNEDPHAEDLLTASVPASKEA